MVNVHKPLGTISHHTSLMNFYISKKRIPDLGNAVYVKTVRISVADFLLLLNMVLNMKSVR